MDIELLQNEVNRLLHLYFTTIGILQRDALDDQIENTITQLLENIMTCKSNIESYLMNKKVKKDLGIYNEKEQVERIKEFIRDGEEFIDKITEMK